MKLIRVKDYEAMTEELLAIFVEQIKEKPDSVLSFTFLIFFNRIRRSQ